MEGVIYTVIYRKETATECVTCLEKKRFSRDGVVWIGVCLLAACLADRRRTCLDMHRRLVLVAKLAGPRFRT
jgi:hypothetical protein